MPQSNFTSSDMIRPQIQVPTPVINSEVVEDITQKLENTSTTTKKKSTKSAE